MVTQTIQFEAVSLREIGSGSITAELFQGSVSKGSLASITEDATRNGRYTGTVADKPAGAYDLQIKYSGYTVSEADLSVDLLLVAGTYVAARLAGLSEVQADTLDSIAIALAGMSPVEPTGTNIRDQLQEIYDGLFPADPDTDPVVITPGTGDITTGWMVCLDETGEAEQDVSVYCQMSDVPSSETGFAHSSRIQTATSAANGVVEFSLVKGASYFFWRGKASPNGTLDPVAIPSEAGSTYELPSIRAIV